MQALILFCLLTLNPPELLVRDSVDLVEINHFYDDHAKLIFDQVIFWDWCDETERFQVRAWRLLKHPDQTPAYNHRQRIYESTWNDGDTLRYVRASQFRETWTQYDPELLERKHLPIDQRAGLGDLIK